MGGNGDVVDDAWEDACKCISLIVVTVRSMITYAKACDSRDPTPKNLAKAAIC